LTLTNGKNLVLTDTSVDNDLRAELARSACQRFTTVLGPGSDEYHENNIHLDLLTARRLPHLSMGSAIAFQGTFYSR
jgi:hypothetical protein